MENIVICAAQSVTRAGLAAMATTATTQVVAKVGSVSALSDWLLSDWPQLDGDAPSLADIAIIEFSFLNAENCKEVLQIIEELPQEEVISIVLLVEEFDPEISLEQALMALLSSGMVSVLSLSVSAGALRSAIATITHGFTILHPGFSASLFTPFQAMRTPLESSLEDALTSREVEVLNELANGLTNKAIAQTLNISEHTVKFHISAILSKLNVASRTEAVAVGIRSGLVML
ncbi:MAG: response regulator transcription factor [Cyanobacteria bacterium J06621_11]